MYRIVYTNKAGRADLRHYDDAAEVVRVFNDKQRRGVEALLLAFDGSQWVPQFRALAL